MLFHLFLAIAKAGVIREKRIDPMSIIGDND